MANIFLCALHKLPLAIPMKGVYKKDFYFNIRVKL